MKAKYLILILLVFACNQAVEQPKTVVENPKINIRKIPIVKKVVRKLKSIQEQHTDYNYKYDWLNGRFRQQPNIYTKTKYFIIYTDNTVEETDERNFLVLDEGDTLQR